jgi:predicted ArsR family transcriptional regulator
MSQLEPTPPAPDDTLNERVGVLTRREIEARILGPFVAALSERFGEAEVRAVLAEVVREAARESGRAMRASTPQDDLESFAALWEPWFRGGALETEELTRTPEVWAFNVTRCRYAELYRALGMAELGVTLSCNRDAALIEGFSGEVEFRRTQTLMEGASHCDFRYRKR